MTIQFSTVECYEEHALDSGQSEGFGLEERNAQVTLRVPWANRYALVEDILSNVREWPYGSQSVKPRAQTALIVPDETKAEQNGQGFTYVDALVTVNYGSNQTQDLIAEEIEPTAEFLTLDHKMFRWGSAMGDLLLEQEAPGKLLKGLNFVRTYFRHVNPSNDFLSLVGSSNNAPLTPATIPTWTFATETLMYHPPNLNRTIKTDGSGYAFTNRVKFSYKPQTWNKFWRAKNQQWEEIYHYESSTVYKNHPPADWSNIWL